MTGETDARQENRQKGLLNFRCLQRIKLITFAVMNTLLSARPLPSFHTVYALLRMVTGFFMLLHGWEVFDARQMADYVKWLSDLQFPAPSVMAWLGKSTELIAGAGLMLGFATRFMAIPLMIAMLVVAFGMGQGKIWYGDQHPFMFVLLCTLFLFGGGGKWSLDDLFFDRK